MKNFLCALIIFLSIVLSGCISKFTPLPADDIIISEDFAIYKKGEILYAFRKSSWPKEPQNLANYYTVVKIIVKNKSDKEISVQADDLHLLDEDRNQYEPVSAKDIIKMHYQSHDFYVDKFNFEEFTDKQDYEQQLRQARINILNEAFDFGKVMPNAQKTGYLFFKRLPRKTKKFFIIIKNKEIVFKKLK